MADYESLAHLSRWRRLVIWLFENKVGRSASGLVFVAILTAPGFYFGRVWVLALAGLAIGFVAGYKLASSYAKSGQIPPEL